MEAILLHRSGKKPLFMKDALSFENIFLTQKTWNPVDPIIDASLFNTSLILVQGDRPDYRILTALSLIRKRSDILPIIFIDEKQNEEVEKQVLTSGGDLYIAPPFDFTDIALQCKRIMAKYESPIMRCLKAYNLKLDLNRRLARRANKTIGLCNKEFSLLEFFIMNRGRVLTRSTILEHVWDRNARFASNTLDVHINRLRRKLDDPFPIKLIHTVHSIGYRFDKE